VSSRVNVACGTYMNSAEGAVRLRRVRDFIQMNTAKRTMARPPKPPKIPPATAPLLMVVVSAF